MKWRLGKLPHADAVVNHYRRVIVGLGAQECPILSFESLKAGCWPAAHRDPFDRLLAAQAVHRDLTLAISDDAFRNFAGLRSVGL